MDKPTVQQALQTANHALAHDEAAIADITRLITNHQNGKRPYYIYDNVTGAKLGMSQLPVFEKRLEAYNGDILRMFAEYKGRSSGAKKEKPIRAAKRTFKKTEKESDEPKREYEFTTTKTNEEGIPIEQEYTIREDDKIVRREIRRTDLKTDKVEVERVI